MEFDEDSTFCYSGVVNIDESIYPAVGLTDSIITLPVEERQKLIKGWIELLQGCLHENFLEESFKEVDLEEEEEILLLVSTDSIWEKEIPNNVVLFEGKKHE